MVTINTPQRIGPAIESVVHRSRRILGPRLMVARVASSVWREVVRRLAATSSVVVIDVSEPTENLLWEIETIRPGKHSHWILVGESHHLEQMKTTDAGTMTPERRQLLQVIDGEEVLSYSRARADLRRFTRALGAMLRVLGSGGRP